MIDNIFIDVQMSAEKLARRRAVAEATDFSINFLFSEMYCCFRKLSLKPFNCFYSY
jgi:hypothetical protein